MSSSSIGKGELVRRLAARLGIPKADAEVAIEETVYEIGHALTAGESVSLPGLGRHRHGRSSHQPDRSP
jgi:nucleoid DNA-binding protein